MTTWQLGQTVSWVMEVRNASGTLEDLGGGNPTATVTRPDGTTAAATVTKTATGIYRADVVSTLAGRHLCTFTGSGTNSGALPWSDVADVWPLDPRLIISLSDARATLNLAPSVRRDDDELRLYIAAATQIVEDIVGPVLVDTVTETRSGGRQAIALYQLPAAITSVTEDGTLVAATGYCLDEAGVLWRGATPQSGYWSTGARNVVIAYTVGSAVLPAGIIAAARELVQHLVTSGQQSWRPPYGSEEVVYTPSGFAVPNRVRDLLAPFAAGRLPGLA